MWDAATGDLVRVVRAGLQGAKQLAVAADESLVVLSYAKHVAVRGESALALKSFTSGK